MTAKPSSGRVGRMALTVDPEIPVPPRLYGGIERVVAMLADGLAERGWEVILFAHPDSRTEARLMPYPRPRSRGAVDVAVNMTHVCRGVLNRRCRIVHSFGRLAYLAPLLPLSLPKIMSYQRHISPRSVRWGHRLSRGTLHFTACGRHLINGVAGLGRWQVVPNGVPLPAFPFRERVAADAPLVFLGRIEPIKGPHLAIEAARKAGRDLILAGNVPEQGERFFDEQIAPHLNQDTCRYIGPVDDARKSELLGNAAALLMPIQWEEPFGIVMAEALACGAPVIGLRRGSVPEVVTDGVDGFVCDSVDEMAAAAARLDRIDRKNCRRTAEARFSHTAIVDQYERLYLELV